MSPPRPTSVLHLLAPARTGGLETAVRTLAGAQATGEGRVHLCPIVPPHSVPHPFVERAREAAVDVRPLVVPDHSYLREFRAISRALDGADPDLVHTHGCRADVIGGLAAHRRGLPAVSTVHGFTGRDWKKRWIYERLQLLAYRRFEAVVAVARSQLQRLRDSGVPEGQTHLIRNAWTPERRLPSRREALEMLGGIEASFVIGWVGRLSSEKGADIFLRALADFDRCDWKAVIVGEGARSGELHSLTRELGLEERVAWCGAVPEAFRVFPAFDVFVLSSRREGTPMVLLEAMEAGVPVVAADVGGVADLLENTALIVPKESPEALRSALCNVRDNPEAAARRSRAARSRVRRRFGVRDWARAYEEVYRRVAHRT